MTNSSIQDVPRMTASLWTVLVTMEGFITIIGIAFNGFGLIVQLFGRLHRKIMGVYMVSMTLNDLGFAILVLPVSLHVSVVGTSRGWSCDWFAVSMEFFMRGSITGLAALCLDRYVAIRWPYWHSAHVTPSGSAYICGALWAVNMLLQMILYVTSDGGRYTRIYQVCGLYATGGAALVRRCFQGFNLFICYLTVIITSVYIGIVVRRHRRQVAAQDQVTGNNINPMDASILASFQAVWQMALVLLLTGVPRLLLLAVPTPMLLAQLAPFLLWLAYTNCIFNVVVYSFQTQAFREASKSLIRRVINTNRTNTSVESPVVDAVDTVFPF